MGYKVFRFKLKDALECKTGSDGFQIKFISSDNLYFIKVQCELGGYLMDDWKVEAIATKLCKHFNISCIEQRPCKVFVDNKEYYGVYSKNLRNMGYSTMSFKSYLKSRGCDMDDDWFVNCDTITKIKRLAYNISYFSGININNVENYIVSCALMDILVYNNDRHPRNFHLLTNGKSICLAPIHDFGMGLFENDYSFKKYNTWEECNRFCYIAPYGEDAFELLNILDRFYNVKSWFKSFKKPVLNKNIFPSAKAYKYFQVICKEIWDDKT